VNCDGKPDLITTTRAAVIVLINTTAPHSTTLSFAQQTFVNNGSGSEVVVADINNDGKPDLIVENWGVDSVSVLPRKGDGVSHP